MRFQLNVKILPWGRKKRRRRGRKGGRRNESGLKEGTKFVSKGSHSNAVAETGPKRKPRSEMEGLSEFGNLRGIKGEKEARLRA